MPAVAAVAAVMLALIALLLMYGTAAAGKWLAQWFPGNISLGVSGISFSPRSWVESAANAVLSGIKWVVGDLIRPVVGFILRPVMEFLNWLGSVEAFVITAGSTLYWIVNDGIPQALTAVRAWSLTRLAALSARMAHLYELGKSYALSLYHKATAYAATLYHRALTEAAHLYALAKTYAKSLVIEEEKLRHTADAAVKAYAVSLVKSATTDLSKAIGQVEKEVKAITSTTIPDVAKAVAAGVSEAEAFAQAAAAGAAGALSTSIPAALAGVFDGLIDDVGALEDVIGTDLPDIGDLVRAIPRAVPLDLAGTIGMSLAVERVMARYLTRCGVPNCRNLGGLGHLLGDLAGAASLGALLAMLAEMIHDPESAARATADELGSLVSEAQHLAGDLLGV